MGRLTELTEFYAGQALTGMLAHPKRYRPRNPGANWHEAIAIEAFEIARQMVKQAALEAAERNE